MGQDSPSGTEVAFKRRKSVKRQKNRKRPRSETSEAEDRVLIGSTSAQQETTAKPGPLLPKWQREEFAASSDKPTSELWKEGATKERRDIGGEKTPSKPAKAFGPLSAPTHLRTSVRVDYQPDVCKDYKETGYCGFGDACKFLHDRSDYKAGWQLERDWAAKQKERRERIQRGEDPDAEPNDNQKQSDTVDTDGLPFACFICRESFKMPVETLCKHYFCEDCVLSRMKNDMTCPICHKQLRGTLNAAHRLRAKLANKG